MLVAVAVITAVLVIGVVVMTILVMTKPEIFSGGKKNNTIEYAEEEKTSDIKGSPIAGQMIGDTKSFIPFAGKGIENSAINMGYYNYRAIIEVSSINFALMSDGEQKIVETSYQRFLNSLNFPVEIYIQTREIDTETIMKNLQKNAGEAVKKFPGINDYLNHYINDMAHLTDYTGNSKIKKKYIIVPYDSSELTDMSALSGEEIREFVLEELDNRCGVVRNGLEGVGLTTKRLNDAEIAECLFAYYHRNLYNVANDFVYNTYDSLVINGELEKPDKRTVFNTILTEAENKINAELRSLDCPDYELKLYKYVNEVLEYFKSDEGMNELIAGFKGEQRVTYDFGEGDGYAKENQKA